MRPERYSPEALVGLLRQRKIATMDDLKEALGTSADATVFRKLALLEYRTSYSHRGRYYTLDEVARFDELGLWSFRQVWFSRFGTLVSTVEALVVASEAGYDAAELEAVLNVEAKAALLKLVRSDRLAREQVWPGATCTSRPRPPSAGPSWQPDLSTTPRPAGFPWGQACGCCLTSSRRRSCCSTASWTSASGGSTPGWRP
jgi:hypothetical protein